jgi:diadenylate cyclase
MNPLLSNQMGTRHRAGIGITEETDAVSVIVSEETGGISVAVGGHVERDLTPAQLRLRLNQLLGRYAPAAAGSGGAHTWTAPAVNAGNTHGGER